MSIEYFLDTIVFVYLFDETNDRKREKAVRPGQESLENETGCISYQVVQETITVITRRLNAAPEKARQILDLALLLLWRINPTRALYQRGLDLPPLRTQLLRQPHRRPRARSGLSHPLQRRPEAWAAD